MAPVAILDVQKSLCIAFLTISDQYHNFIFVTFFYKMAAGGHFAFWMSEKSLSVAFLDISDKYETFFFKFTKWPPAPFWMSEIHF